MNQRTCLILAVTICLAISLAGAAETTVRNDTLVEGGTGNIQAGFVPTESAAAWLTSPCAGDIVAVQVFWRSVIGTTPQSIEDSITIFNGGIFPQPGPVLETIVGPVMTDAVFNEFRFLDENMVIPLIVPVSNGQEFVVSFKFLNAPNQTIGPSVVDDDDGCQNGKNALHASIAGQLFWFSSCALGVQGDWIIRAIIDCQEGSGPGSTPNGGDAPGTPLLMDRLGNGDLQLTWSPSCSDGDDDYEIYQGLMGVYPSHFRKICTTDNATTTTFSPDNFDRYYLVVPTNGSLEGSYGRDSQGNERVQGGNACHVQPPLLSCP